jgi:hypothetical protein
LFADDLPPGPLREALLGVAGVRVLLPLAVVRCRERSFDVLDSEAKTVVRLALEMPEGLRPRLRLGGVRGYDSALTSVGETLIGELGFHAADEPLVDEAIRAAGGVPAG